MTATPKFAAQELSANESQPQMILNADMRLFEQLSQIAVISRTTTTPPASPSDGDAYLIPSGATGVWTGRTGLAYWQSNAWAYFVPTSAHRIMVAVKDQSNIVVLWDGSAFIDYQSQSAIGSTNKSVAGSSNVILTAAEAKNLSQIYTGVLTGDINVVVPTSAAQYIVDNRTTGAHTLTVKTSGGTGTLCPQSARTMLVCDGVNVDSAAGSTTGAYQPLDADLTAIAGLTSAANKIPYFTGSATAALLTLDTDGTLAANSDTSVPSQKAVRTYVGSAVTGLLDFKGSTDCSANPNYPAASKGDAYIVSVAGKIGGASGASVDIGDAYFATADNAGGTQGSVGSSWDILEHNLVGALLTANALSELSGAASTARGNIGAIGGSTGSIDNALLRADGTGGATAQASGVFIGDDHELYNYRAKINLQTGTSYTLVEGDTGKIVELTNAAAIALTADPTLPVGFNCTIVQGGAGQVTIASTGSGTVVNRSSQFKTAGVNAFCAAYVRGNSGGSAAIVVFGGDTAA